MKQIKGTLTIYAAGHNLPRDINRADKKELDKAIRELKEKGRKFEGTFYLNGVVDVVMKRNHPSGWDCKIEFLPDGVNHKF